MVLRGDHEVRAVVAARTRRSLVGGARVTHGLAAYLTAPWLRMPREAASSPMCRFRVGSRGSRPPATRGPTLTRRGARRRLHRGCRGRAADRSVLVYARQALHWITVYDEADRGAGVRVEHLAATLASARATGRDRPRATTTRRCTCSRTRRDSASTRSKIPRATQPRALASAPARRRRGRQPARLRVDRGPRSREHAAHHRPPVPSPPMRAPPASAT